MKRRLSLRVLLIALLALQISALAAPAMATNASAASSVSTDCPDDHGAVDKDCPCCPPGISTIASCAVQCAGTTAATPALVRLRVPASLLVPREFESTLIASQIYSPLNRPPIG